MIERVVVDPDSATLKACYIRPWYVLSKDNYGPTARRKTRAHDHLTVALFIVTDSLFVADRVCETCLRVFKNSVEKRTLTPRRAYAIWLIIGEEIDTADSCAIHHLLLRSGNENLPKVHVHTWMKLIYVCLYNSILSTLSDWFFFVSRAFDRQLSCQSVWHWLPTGRAICDTVRWRIFSGIEFLALHLDLALDTLPHIRS